jgi:hypothetical protein
MEYKELWRGHPSEPLIEALIVAVAVGKYLPPNKPVGWGKVGRTSREWNSRRIVLNGARLSKPFKDRVGWVMAQQLRNDRFSRFSPVLQWIYMETDLMRHFIEISPAARNVLARMSPEDSITRLQLACARIYVAALRKADRITKESDDEHP